MLVGFLSDRMMKAAHKGDTKAGASAKRRALAAGVVISSRSRLALLLLRISDVFADGGAAACHGDNQTTVVAIAGVVAVAAAAVAWLWWPPAPDPAQTHPPPWWPWSRSRLASRIHLTQAVAADDDDDSDVSDEVMGLPEYVVVWQVNPEAKHVLSYDPETMDADLEAACARLPDAEDASVYEFGTDYRQLAPSSQETFSRLR